MTDPLSLPRCHCEERSDEAISIHVGYCFPAFVGPAMTDAPRNDEHMIRGLA